jgi:phage protein D
MRQAETVEISVDGRPLPVDAAGHLVEVVVDQEVSAPALFILRLAEADDLQPFRWIDDDQLFSIGNAVEIRFAGAGQNRKVMTGEITALEPDFAGGGRPSLAVQGYDRLHRLMRGTKTRTFLNCTDSEIVSTVASPTKLAVNASVSGDPLGYVMQYNCSDLAFLQDRAARIGWELLVEDNTLFFRPAANSDVEVLSLTLHEGLYEFSPRLSTMGQVSKVTVRGWDAKNRQSIVGVADAVSTFMGGRRSGAKFVSEKFGNAELIEVDRAIATQKEADLVARGAFNKMALQLIVGEGACDGRPDLHAGKVVGLKGLGKRFSGPYYVTRAIHTYAADRGYETRFHARRTAL